MPDWDVEENNRYAVRQRELNLRTTFWGRLRLCFERLRAALAGQQEGK